MDMPDMKQMMNEMKAMMAKMKAMMEKMPCADCKEMGKAEMPSIQDKMYGKNT